MLAFQAADIYQIQAFRGYEKQYFSLASAWSVVFLVTIGVTFFAKLGDSFSRIWLGTFFVLGLITLLVFRRALFTLVRRWTREGRLDRRTVIVGADERGDTADPRTRERSAIPTSAWSACSTTAAKAAPLILSAARQKLPVSSRTSSSLRAEDPH